MASPQQQRPRAYSKGEELYLVHLARSSADPHPEDNEDDHDYPPPRSPKKSIGEELFEIHLKRSQGFPPDYDIAEEDQKQEVSKEESKHSDGKQYNLRTRKA